MLASLVLMLACTREMKDGVDSAPTIDDTGETGIDGDDSGGSDDSGTDDSGTKVDHDLDDDGFTPEEGDCDDDDADVHPDGDEGLEADDVDQDCSGTADDATICTGAGGDFNKIQPALDAVSAGFTLYVCAGTYDELLTIEKAVALLSIDGADVTTIQGDATDSVVRIDTGNDVVLQGFTIQGGLGTDGGGIHAADAQVEILDNVIVGNTAENRGGGLYLEDTEGTISGNRFEGNVAYEGGGLSIDGGDPEIASNEILSNDCTTIDEKSYGGGGGGGGVFLINSDAEFHGNRIEGNHSSYNGAGIFFWNWGGEVREDTVLSNDADEDGGGLYFSGGTGDVFDSHFEGNTAVDDGAGVRVFHGVGMEFSGNTFIGNEATDNGGGLKLSHSSNTITSNHFEDNVSGDHGGGLELDNEWSDVSDCTFINNRAVIGGGMHSWMAEAPIDFWDLTFEGNEATDCGGAIGIDNDPLGVTITDVTITGSRAPDGAAFCVEKLYQDDKETYTQSSDVTLRNIQLWDNVATDDAGAFFVRFGDVRIGNVTAVGTGGGHLFVSEGSLDVMNTIFAEGTGAFAFIDATEGTEGSIAMRYSLFSSNMGGWGDLPDPIGTTGNIDGDPAFVDLGAGDFGLTAASDAIDAGDPAIQDTDGTRSDIGRSGGPGGW